MPSPTLYHFAETKIDLYTALPLPTSLKLIVPNYSLLVFSWIFELVLNAESNPAE